MCAFLVFLCMLLLLTFWMNDSEGIRWQLQFMIFSITQFFLRYPVISYILSLNFVFYMVFSNTLNLCSSLKVRNRVSYPYKTTSKIPFCLRVFYDWVSTSFARLWDLLTRNVVTNYIRRNDFDSLPIRVIDALCRRGRLMSSLQNGVIIIALSSVL